MSNEQQQSLREQAIAAAQKAATPIEEAAAKQAAAAPTKSEVAASEAASAAASAASNAQAEVAKAKEVSANASKKEKDDKKPKWDVAVRLVQKDDDLTEVPTKPKLSALEIKEHQKVGTDWKDSFDWRSGLKPNDKEIVKKNCVSKYAVITAAMTGTGKNRKQKVVNGVKQFQPKWTYESFPTYFDEEEVKQDMSKLFDDLASTYIFECLIKEHFNKSVSNKHYERKMPLMAINHAFPVSFSAVEQISGKSFLSFCQSHLRKGWYRSGGAATKFNVDAACGVSENRDVILANIGRKIAEWTPAIRKSVRISAKDYKRIGKGVEKNFLFRGVKPKASLFRDVITACQEYITPLENHIDSVDAKLAKIEDKSLPEGSVSPADLVRYEKSKKYIGYWSLAICGLDSMAADLEKKEADKLATVKVVEPTIEDFFEDMEALDI